MNDEIFRAMRDQMKPSEELARTLDEAITAADAAPSLAHDDGPRLPVTASSGHVVGVLPTVRPTPKQSWLWAFVGAAACVALAVAANSDPLVNVNRDPVNASGVFATARPPLSPGDRTQRTDMTRASTYDEVFDVVEATGWWDERDYALLSGGGDLAVADAGTFDDVAEDEPAPMPEEARDAAPQPAAPEAPAADRAKAPVEKGETEVATATGASNDSVTLTNATESESEESGAQDHSDTNVQVEGIDEGDIVKTDGRAIYIASKDQVAIVDPAGDATTEIARIDLSRQLPAAEGSGVIPGAVIDLMISGTTLVVLACEYESRGFDEPPNSSSFMVPYEATGTKAILYDIADPSDPKLITTLTQSGSYSSSRLQGGILYVITNYTLNTQVKPDKDDPTTFVPIVKDGKEKRPVLARDITIMPAVDYPSYTVVTAIDVASGTHLSEQSVLGSAETVYMSNENLYIAGTSWPDGYQKSPLTKELLGAGKVYRGQITTLVRFALNSGRLAQEANVTLLGSILNQFSLDEYDGHLRVALTLQGELLDKEDVRDGQVFAAGEWLTRSSLVVLDGDLKVVGAIPTLAERESVRSARFTGPVGYVVTFEQTDPLFALDLSNPSRPTVMSALKIPGFSSYLHPWGEGKLLGLGYRGNDQGVTNGLKLSIFDTSDPFDVSEMDEYRINWDHAEALSNHKAVLVDANRGLFAFSGMTWDEREAMSYRLYSYTDAAGFSEVADLAFLDAPTGWWSDSVTVRGIIVGDYLYICWAGSVTVYSLDGFDQVASLQINEITNPYIDPYPMVDEEGPFMIE
ncbi:MAG: beta-propeller domain-containing protein [Micrococcales bacterium]|nr:beta-propeller domain-containing protein [Micrococcales bacterium]